jgi:carbon storage regulator CsrA
MLVLSRKLDQRIQIGDNITITVLRVRGGTVQIGIEAPRSTSVLRSELTLQPKAGLRQNPETDAASLAAAAAMPRQRRSLAAGGEHSRTVSQIRPARSWNPGEQTGLGTGPLAGRLHARRVPSACTATLSS